MTRWLFCFGKALAAYTAPFVLICLWLNFSSGDPFWLGFLGFVPMVLPAALFVSLGHSARSLGGGIVWIALGLVVALSLFVGLALNSHAAASQKYFVVVLALVPIAITWEAFHAPPVAAGLSHGWILLGALWLFAITVKAAAATIAAPWPILALLPLMWGAAAALGRLDHRLRRDERL